MKLIHRIPPLVVSTLVLIIPSALGLVRSAADPYGVDTAERLLQTPMTIISDGNMRLDDAVRSIATASGVRIVADWDALGSAGVSPETRVICRLRNVSASRSLRSILDWVSREGPLRIRYVLDGATVRVTTEDQTLMRRVSWVYDCNEFFRSTESSPEKDATLLEIQRLIIETIDSDSWTQNGGRLGEIKFDKARLIVTHHVREQFMVAKLMEQIRETHTYGTERWRHVDLLNAARPVRSNPNACPG